MKKAWRRFLAGACIVSLLMTTTGISVMADEDESIFTELSEDVSVINQNATEEQGVEPDEEEGISDESLTTDEEILDQSVTEEVVGDAVASMNWTYINPVYDHWITAQDLRPLTEIGEQSMETDDYYSNAADAAVYLSDEMERRADTIIVNYRTTENHHSHGLMEYIFECAVNSDSGATEGDYLFFQYGGWNGQVSVYDPGDGYYYYSMIYAVTYFTDAVQESAVTEEVNNLIVSWNLQEKSTYERVKAVYDYLVQNVTYREDYTSESSTAYAALINKSANSYGFYTAMYRLLQECKVPCRVITGKDNIGTDNETKCAWNIIKIGQRYFNADPALEVVNYSAGQPYSYFLIKGYTDEAYHVQDEYVGNYGRLVSDVPFSETDYIVLEKDPVWSWSQDWSAATVTFNQGLTDEVSLDAEISSVLSDKSRAITYTATVLFNGEEFTDTKTREVGDEYGEPVWEWDGYSKATAIFTGATGADIQRKEATTSWYAEIINRETGAGRIIYNATVDFGGRSYSDKKYADFTEQVYVCDSRDDIVQRGREAFCNCEIGTTFLWPTDIGVTFDDLEELQMEILEHTGNPAEGDYLKRNISGSYCYLEDTVEKSGREYYAWGIANQYRTTADQERELSQWIDDIIAGFDFNDTTTDYEKFMTIYDYICNHVSYDNDEALFSHSAYSAAIFGIAVCEGYSTLLYRMLLEAGVDNRIIIGEIAKNEIWISFASVSSMGHAWNIVKIGDLYYETDSTWDASHVGPNNPTASLMYDNCLKASLKVHDRDDEYNTDEFKNAYPVSDISYQAVPDAVPGDGLTCRVENKTLYLSGVGYIKDYEFESMNRMWTDQIIKAVIKDGVTGIGQCSFKDMWKLNEVIIPGSVKRIKQHAFINCRELELLQIGEGVTKIDDEAFILCNRKLTKVEIPGSVKEIGAAAFMGCDRLSEVVLNDGIRIIGKQAFYTGEKDNLTQITIPGSVIEIGDEAFGYYLNEEGSYDNIEPIPGFKIYGYAGSAAETYAEQNGFDFISLGTYVKKDISTCSVSLHDTEFVYDGTHKRPEVIVKDGDDVLEKKYDYTVMYKNNLNAGTAEILLNGVGKYEGTKTITFEIMKAEPELTFSEENVSKTTFDEAFTNELTMKSNGAVTFISGNVEVAYIDKTSGQVSIKGIGTVTMTAQVAETDNYKSGSRSYVLTIIAGKPDISGFNIVLSQTNYIYNGSAKKPAVRVENGETELISGMDYIVRYEDNINAGTATAIICGIGAYKGEATATFTIEKAEPELTFAKEIVYKTPNDEPFVNEMTKKTDGDIIYFTASDDIVNIDDNGLVTILGTGTAEIGVTTTEGENYQEGLFYYTVDVREKKIDISVCKVTITPTSYTYNGSMREPMVTVEHGNTTLYSGTDYMVSYKDNTNAGIAKVTITGKGSYSGTVDKTFTINKAAPELYYACASVSKTTQDATFTNELMKTTDGNVAFRSSNVEVAAVNENTGEVSIKGVGSTVITATSAESDNYEGGSAQYTLTVKCGRIEIISQPESCQEISGKRVNLVVEAVGDRLSYQWQYLRKGTAAWADSGLSSAHSSTLNFKMSAGYDGMQFRCVLTDENGQSVTSDEVMSTMITAPEIVEQPGDTEAALGENVKISVTASGTDLAYQWQYQKAGTTTWKNSGLSSATNAALRFKMSSGYDEMKFRCKVTNADGLYVYSDAASITLVEGPGIVVQPGDVNASIGTTIQIRTVAAGTGLTYSWQYQRPSTTTWNKSGLSSASSSTLSFKMSSGYDGMKFRCKVTDADGRVVYTDAALVKIAAGPTIAKQPEDVTAVLGTKATFSVVAEGNDLTYQWQFQKVGKTTWVNSTSASNKTDTLKVSAATGTNGLKFRCVVTDGDGNITISNYATLTAV